MNHSSSLFHRMALASKIIIRLIKNSCSAGFFNLSRFAPPRAEVSGLPKEYRKMGRIGKKFYFTENNF